MNKKILFSPIGGTDPIKYYRDGSMLHICRYYQPDVVYLYLSHEMMAHHNEDNRFCISLEKLGKYLNHEFEIKIIERNELINVQQYDVFYQDFRTCIRDIEEKMDETDSLYINMASGTPAMKSALLVMATLAEYRFQPIQVSTPQKKMNTEYEEREPYDIEFQWELNEDNEQNQENRCEEIKCLNLMLLLKIDMIKKHLAAYDYHAALTVAGEIKDEVSKKAYTLLRIADERVKLNSLEINKLLIGKDYQIFPIRDSSKQKIFEYGLVLQMKVQKEEYADFIRAVTPIVVDVLEMILKTQCKFDVANYYTINCRTKAPEWNIDKLKTVEGVLEGLNSKYARGGGFRGGIIYSSALESIIKTLSDDIVLVQKVSDMTKVEAKVRNMAAHEIVSVTDEWFKKKTGKSANEIFAIIKYLINKAGIEAKEEYWNSYDNMNKLITKHLY